MNSPGFLGFINTAYKHKFIEEENWSRANADGFDFFDLVDINWESDFVTKALKGIKKERPGLLNKTGAINKSNTKSVATREKANELFKEKKWIAALKKYSKSIALAENNSTELGFAYANRSALLLHRGFYKECLEDIERALILDYPASKKQQLIIRREKATELVSTQKKTIIQEKIPTLTSENKTLRGASEAIEIAEDNTFGRFIQATRDIAPGEIILIENPYALVISQDYKTTHCGNCGNLSFNPIPCKKCAIEMYCSKRCRDNAYNDYHQYECIVLNYYPPEIFNIEDIPKEERNILNICTEEIRQLTLRITLKGFKNFQNSSDSSEDLYDEIAKLQTHRNDLSKSALMILAFNLAKQFQILKKHTNLLSKLHFKDKEEILKYHLLRNRLICCFNVATLQYKLDEAVNEQITCSSGIGLYTSYSMFNHACVENVFYGFYGSTMVVRAIRKIKKGEQCFINYGFFFHQHHKLQRDFYITRNHLFTCKCVACEKDWPTFNKTKLSKEYTCLNSTAYTLIETLTAIVKSQKICSEERRQDTFEKCAGIEQMIKNEGPTMNLILFQDLLHLITGLRYQGTDF